MKLIKWEGGDKNHVFDLFKFENNLNNKDNDS